MIKNYLHIYIGDADYYALFSLRPNAVPLLMVIIILMSNLMSNGCMYPATPPDFCYLLFCGYGCCGMCCPLPGNDIHFMLILAVSSTVLPASTCGAAPLRLTSCSLCILPMARRYSSFLLSSHPHFNGKRTEIQLSPLKVVKNSSISQATVSNANYHSIGLASVRHSARDYREPVPTATRITSCPEEPITFIALEKKIMWGTVVWLTDAPHPVVGMLLYGGVVRRAGGAGRVCQQPAQGGGGAVFESCCIMTK